MQAQAHCWDRTLSTCSCCHAIKILGWSVSYSCISYKSPSFKSHPQWHTPYERLHGHKPDYSFLRVFGCACWPNLRPYNTTKLQFRSKRCVFLGYSNSHKGFKCLDPSVGRVYISRDIVFDENVFPFSELHPNAGARLRAEISLLPESLLSSTFFGDAKIAWSTCY